MLYASQLLCVDRAAEADRVTAETYALIRRQKRGAMAQSLVALRRHAACLAERDFVTRAKAARSELALVRELWGASGGDAADLGADCDARLLNELAWEMVESPAESAALTDQRLAVRVARSAAASQPDDWHVLNTLGVALLRAGLADEALGVLRRSDRLSRAEVQNGDWANHLFIALALERLDRAGEAVDALRNAVAAKGLPAERLAEAAPLLRRLLDETRRAQGAAHAETRLLLSSLALVHETPLGDPQGAEPLLRELLSVSSESPSGGREVPVAAEVRARLASVLCRLRRFQEAERVAVDAASACRAAQPQDQVALSAALAVAGEAMLGPRLPERAAAAEAVLRECVELRRRHASHAWLTHDAAGMLGEAVALQGRFAEAEPLLTEAARRIQPPPGRAYRRADAVGRVVSLYERWERAAPGCGYAALAERWKNGATGR